MLMNVYTVFDVASGHYMRPFFCQADGEALRMFKDLANDMEHPMGQHPEDYSLCRVGEWNDQTGDIHERTLEVLCQGLEMVSQKRNELNPVEQGDLDMMNERIVMEKLRERKDG